MEDEMEVVAAVLLCLWRWWPSRCRQRCVMHGKKGAICQRRRFHFAFTFKDCLPKENRQTASPEYRSYRRGAQEEDRSKLSLGTHSSTLEQIFQLKTPDPFFGTNVQGTLLSCAWLESSGSNISLG